MNKAKYIGIIILFIVSACGTEKGNAKQDEAWALISQLEGEWREESGYVEYWFVEDDKSLSGKGMMQKNGKLQLTETLRIVENDSGIIYQAAVAGQNEGQTIGFPLVKSNASQLIFENRAHDFPNRISYTFVNDSLMNIRVESLSDSSRYFVLNMSRGEIHKSDIE